jgi:hypothetical protein
MYPKKLFGEVGCRERRHNFFTDPEHCPAIVRPSRPADGWVVAIKTLVPTDFLMLLRFLSTAN